jgi:NADH-quinone oxidoreductase subunit C
MRRTPQQVHEALCQRFAEGIEPFAEPKAGDPWIQVAPALLHDVCEYLKAAPELDFDLLRLVTGVDWGDRLSSVYHLYSVAHGHELTLRVDLDRAAPSVASVADLWPAADWHEREAWDMMGIVYEGHPSLRRILLPEDWEGHPLRKDYVAPKEYNGITNE